MEKLHFLKEIDGIHYYSYKPSLFCLYYDCYKGVEIPPYFSRMVHKIRMTRELLKNKYQVIYMIKENKVLGHLVVARGGSRIEMSKKDDIVIGPVWVIPSERSYGYASNGIHFILDEMGIDYNFAYEFIEKDNKPSIRTVEKNGFEFVADCNEYGLFKVIRPCINGHLKVYRKQNKRNGENKNEHFDS